MSKHRSKPRRDLAAWEQRRLEAARLFAAGIAQPEVARRLKVTPMSVNRWYHRWRQEGEAGLARGGPPGPKPRLSPEQVRQLEEALLAGPTAAGYATELWTLQRIAKLIRDRFGVRYHQSHVWLLLRKLNWSCQKPAKRAKERDEQAIRRWLEGDWPRIKRGHRSEGPPWSSGTRPASPSAPASGAPGPSGDRPRS
jgi:transposase